MKSHIEPVQAPEDELRHEVQLVIEDVDPVKALHECGEEFAQLVELGEQPFAEL
jgi:hypothetical protein